MPALTLGKTQKTLTSTRLPLTESERAMRVFRGTSAFAALAGLIGIASAQVTQCPRPGFEQLVLHGGVCDRKDE
jgi:hypothetical protein